MKREIPTTNISDKESQDKYIKKYFTAEGYDTLLNFTKTLTKEFFKRAETEYPFKLPLIWGVPQFDWASEFEDKSILESRIRGYMQFLGIDSISVKVKDSDLTLSYEGEK